MTSTDTLQNSEVMGEVRLLNALSDSAVLTLQHTAAVRTNGSSTIVQNSKMFYHRKLSEPKSVLAHATRYAT